MSPLDPSLWPRLDTLLEEMLELSPGARARALARLGQGEPELRRALETLLRADARRAGILETGPDPYARSLISGALEDEGAEDASALPRVERYRLLRLLGRGGMGRVYLAERSDGELGGPVALKILGMGMDSGEIRRRFLLERSILARLEHPGIARLLDGGLSEDGRPYFAMEFVEGRPLTRYADARRLTLRERLQLFEDACEAVAYAQQHLIVHRDLKPSNILVTPDGQVKLLDFGIAKLLAEAEGGEARTRTGLFLMTPEYAAPEQLRGEPVTTATDVYALGVVLFELLSGRHPLASPALGLLPGLGPREARPLSQALRRSGRRLDADAELAAAARRLGPRALRRQLRGELAVIVDTALRPEPERRYPSVEAMLQDLRRLREGRPLQARPPAVAYRLRKYLRRHRVAMSASAVAVLTLSLGLLATAWQARIAQREAARAEAVQEFVTSIFTAADPDASSGSELRVRDLLASGAARVDTELAGQPELQADLLQVIGRIYVTLGDYPSALPLLRRALQLWEALLSPGDPQLRQAMVALGSAELQVMDLEAADSLLNGALPLFDRRPGHTGPELAELLSLMAILEQRRDHLEEAERLDRQALTLDREHFGPDHEEVAMDLSNLGSLLSMQGRYAEAADMHQQALALRRRLLPPMHSTIPVSLHNLAFCLRHLGREAEADSLYSLSIALRRQIYPDGHPQLAGTLRERAALQVSLGAYALAESLLAEAVAMDRRLLGEQHSDTALALNELGLVAYRRGDYEQAVARFAEALSTLQALLPPEHSTLATVGGNLVGSLRSAGQPEAADSVAARLDSLRAAAGVEP